MIDLYTECKRIKMCKNMYFMNKTEKMENLEEKAECIFQKKKLCYI